MQRNKKTTVASPKTHGGATASRITPLQKLTRSSLACMLWENSFYEDGQSIADRISMLSHQVTPYELSSLAIKARNDFKLRHAPLLLTKSLINHPAIPSSDKSIVSNTIYDVVQRADEMPELLSMYWGGKKKPIAAQLKKGLAKAFTKFDAYQLAKYNRDKDIKLRDVLFMVHAKPKNAQQASDWKKLCDGTLEAPDTWEVNLSTGKNKAETFTRLIGENKLGGMALLKNLRGMTEAGVNSDVIRGAIKKMKTERILPFRFITAARYAPQFEDALEESMMSCLAGVEKLPGKTVVLIDVSGSMSAAVSQKSDLTRLDAANGIAILAREICDQVSVYTFSNKCVQVAPRRGFALRDAIVKSQPHSCTYLGSALTSIKEDYDRIIVFTDEQSYDSVPAPKGKGYMINVASYENGVAYGPWTSITGFSESTIKYICALEKEISM